MIAACRRMAPKLVVASVGLLGLALSGSAWASGGEEHGGVPTDKIVFHAINLVLLLALLFYVLKDRLRDTLANRAVDIKKTIDDANNERKAALDRLQDIEQRLQGFERQLAELKSEAEAQGRAEAEAIVARANKSAELLKATTERTIQDEWLRARTSLRAEAVDLAVKLAEERLKGALGAADQQRFANEFLASVDGKREVPHG